MTACATGHCAVKTREQMEQERRLANAAAVASGALREGSKVMVGWRRPREAVALTVGPVGWITARFTSDDENSRSMFLAPVDYEVTT